jgi:hypothetical protein
VPNAPAASCALCSWSMHTSIHSGGTGYIRHSPRDGVTAYIALSPGTGLSCPRRSRDKPTTLTPASGRQDHTTLPSAERLSKKPLDGFGTSPAEALAKADQRRSSSVAAASTASHPAFVTTRTPLLPRRDSANTTTDFGFGKSEIFFRKGLDSGIKKQPDGQIRGTLSAFGPRSPRGVPNCSKSRPMRLTQGRFPDVLA